MTSIRGATTAKSNTTKDILESAKELLLEMISANGLDLDINSDQIIDVIFSATKDLNAVYPAVAARELGIVQAGLFCVQEMDVPGSLPMCLRVMLHAEISGKGQSDMKHVYLRGAKILRPDLLKESQRGISIAIDGPSGAGKSTVAKEVAKVAGIIYVDTGAMYRAVALYYIQNGVDLTDAAAVEEGLNDISIDISHDENNRQRLILNGKDVTEALRTQLVAEGSSVTAAYPTVRQKLKTLQQSLAQKHSVVMDGRDIGTHVLPNASLKIFLDASLDERIIRRMGELKAIGQPADYETVKKEINIRDERDINREHAPLSRAKDAVYIKTDGMTVADITNRILKEL